MANFSVDGRLKVKTFKANFKKAFGATLRVYTTTNCKAPANDEVTLASLRARPARKAVNWWSAATFV